MCIVGYFSKCDCGHFSHPSHAPMRNADGITYSSGFYCRDCGYDRDHSEMGGALAIPETMPEYVAGYFNDAAWRARFLPELAHD